MENKMFSMENSKILPFYFLHVTKYGTILIPQKTVYLRHYLLYKIVS
jgi:hypothetical protein